MRDFFQKILLAKTEQKELFYNSSGSKLAYQLGVKHISSAEYLGFADFLPSGHLRIKKDFLLVDFEHETIVTIEKDVLITPIALASL